MKYIVEIKKVESVQIGERFERNDMYGRDSRIPIMEDQTTLILRQEVEKLNIQEFVKLLNGIV